VGVAGFVTWPNAKPAQNTADNNTTQLFIGEF